jgi:hypothetical protein
MRTIHLIAQIDELGRIFISGDSNDRAVSGLYHLMEPTDSLFRKLNGVIEINDKASGGYTPPDAPLSKHQFSR